MKKYTLVLVLFLIMSCTAFAQSIPKMAYVQLGGPGFMSLSIHFDTRFSKKESGFGARAGVGMPYWGMNTPIFPLGVNYLMGRDQKNYLEIGLGYTIVGYKGEPYYSSNIWNATIGYRYSPLEGGFAFKAEITPIFGDGITPFGGISFGYKF